MLCEFGIGRADCHSYVPVSVAELRKGIRLADLRWDRDVFLDLGSGMGRGVVRAATYPFRKVIGVEIAPELNDIARRNVERAKSKLACKDIELITSDCSAYCIPPEVTVIFMFNPFGGHILRKVIENIRKSLAVEERRLQVILVNRTTYEREIGQVDWLVERYHWEGIYENAVYESTVCQRGVDPA